MSDLTIAKRGENIFTLSFRRTDGRVAVFVQAHPQFEALLKSWGSGIASSLYDFGGREWIFPNGVVPEVYDLPQDHVRDPACSLLHLGQPLLIDGVPHNVVNISFLRIVGISRGIEFELAGVYSISRLKEIQDRIHVAVKKLYTDFLLPLDLTIRLNTQETRL